MSAFNIQPRRLNFVRGNVMKNPPLLQRLFALFTSSAPFNASAPPARLAALAMCAATALFGHSAANAGPLMMDAPAAQVALGRAANCSALANGTVRCWGNGFVASNTPIDMPLVGSDVIRVAAGTSLSVPTACALKPNGNGSSVKCFQNATAAPTDAPEFGADVVDFVIRGDARCALKSNGKAFCSGSVPTQGEITMPNGEFALQVASNAQLACARTTLGRVYCWGLNRFGQLGNGTTVASSTPVLTLLPTDFVAVSVGISRGHACAANATGRTMCWGSNSDGELGNGTTSGIPNPTPGDVLTLASGTRETVAFGDVFALQSCARGDTGGVKCWGSNQFATLGNGSAAASAVPVNVTGLSSGIVGLSGSTHGICALGTFGEAWCWGNGAVGELGNGDAGC
jgi:hypothetical protein